MTKRVSAAAVLAVVVGLLCLPLLMATAAERRPPDYPPYPLPKDWRPVIVLSPCTNA